MSAGAHVRNRLRMEAVGDDNAGMACDVSLVARDRELSVVADVIESAADGRGQGVLVTGEAGIGKTRLLREARTVAEQRGLLVLSGRAVEAGGAYRPLVEAFARPAARLASHPDLVGVRPALARVLPGWLAETAVLAPMADPAAVLAAALTVLVQTMAPAGAVLVLDDLQWADPDTISVLTALVDSIESLPLALVAATRGETPTEPALRLGVRDSVRPLPLRRLTPAEVGEVVRASSRGLSVEQLEQLVTVIDGLPVVMDEFIRQIRERGWEAGPLDLGSSTLASAVQLRLAGLSADCRLVLDALAVIGDADSEVLIAATGLDRRRLGAALHAGLASTLLVAAPTSLGVGWRHMLIGEAVRDLLLPLEQQDIARRAADQLADGPTATDGRLRQAAHLYELAGYPHQAAQQLLRAARLAVTHGAFDVALQDLSEAQRLAGDIPENVREMLIERIETLTLAGRAGDAYDTGVAALNEMDSQEAGGLLVSTVRAAQTAGLYRQGMELLATLERGGETPDAELITLQAEAAFDDHRRAEAFKLGRRAATQAQREGRIELACEALKIAGYAATLLAGQEASEVFHQLVELSRQHGLTLWEVKGNEGLGVIDVITNSDPSRLEHAQRLATSAGIVDAIAGAERFVTLTELTRQGILAAHPRILRTVKQARQLRLLELHADTSAHLLDCVLLADQPLPQTADPQQAGDIGTAVAQAMELSGKYSSSWTPIGLKSTLGARAWLHGDSATAIRLIEEDNRRFDGEIKISPWWGFAHLLRVVGGDDPSAAFDRVELTGHHVNWAARAFGTALGRLRAGQSADEALAEAEHHLRNTPFWGHLLRTAAAPAVFQAGPRTTAEGWLREADAFFGAAGERPLQRKVRHTLTAIGVKVPRTGASVPTHLARLGITAREGEILRLVNAGLGNADIAHQLYISVRTVETHVSSMLQKTGATTRDQLPRW